MKNVIHVFRVWNSVKRILPTPCGEATEDRIDVALHFVWTNLLLLIEQTAPVDSNRMRQRKNLVIDYVSSIFGLLFGTRTRR